MKFSTGSVTTRCMCAERAALCEMVDAFAQEMKERLLKKLDQGYSGWDEESFVVGTNHGIIARLNSSAQCGKPIDAANFACFWWNRLGMGRSTDPNVK